ncbi:hypothetical protein BRADI_5g24000v3 [Brachypodium distachyon]|uniref:SGNH hydrolase-type esterase domain-containing protein n=2 Tax=Brachypodium distachyon TaxID=15368 RepID=A0A2K2CJ03_BRADI|nr:hypothetical protein BRADI_5g24000v3 [Brachypodium distachyon]
MFNFGDSFADTGNTPKSGDRLSRAWHYPFGISYKDYNGNPGGNKPTGRFSDYMIQPDLIARMLRIHSAPPAYKQSGYLCHPYGMTFAAAGASVFEAPENNGVFVPTLSQQINKFQDLLRTGFISSTRLEGAVLLVAISAGNDYLPKIHLMDESISSIAPYVENVTSEIARNVERLRNLGAKKILLNNMPPLGCTPRHARLSNYAGCDGHGNFLASVHNDNLQVKLGINTDVHIVDLYSAFTNITSQLTNDTASPVSDQFTTKLAPACEAKDPKGYCGLRDDESNYLYTLDADQVEKHFYWDDMHPTSAGWEAVMKQLEEPIKYFLDH